jgi:hypothetical protein
LVREGTSEISHGGEPPMAALVECVMIVRVAPRPPPKPRGGVASAQTVVERSPPESRLASGPIQGAMDARVADPSADVSLKLLESRGREPSPGSSKRLLLDEGGASKDKGDDSPAMPVENSPKNVLSVRAGAKRPWMGGFSNANS